MKLLDRPMAVAFEKNFPEVILGIVTIVYGLLLTLPVDRSGMSKGYDLMVQYVSLWWWGVAFILFGLLNMYAVLNRKGNLVRGSARGLFFLWFFAAFLFVLSAWTAPGWILMLGLGILYGGVSSEYRTKTKWHDGTGGAGRDL